MPRVLIAHRSEICAQSLVRRLDGQYEICVCCDGTQVASLLDSFAPDILILSTAICCKDALTILQEMVSPPRFVLVVTNYLSPYMEHRLYSLGVHHILLMPSADTVHATLNSCLSTPDPAPNAEYLVHTHLRKLNIPLRLEGFDQICTAVPLLLQAPRQTLSKHIYPAVAQVHNISDQRAVEHAIRSSIQAGWKDRDEAIWAGYFPKNPDGQIPCPTNRQFLYTLAQRIRQSLLKEAPEPVSQCEAGHG